ncbi:hypothetical protein JKP88DRAFT_161883, partial [Tribonema minus]
VAILTGFPCLLDHDPPTETDGPLGAFVIARCCAALGKRVIVLTDDASAEVLMAAAAGCGVAGAQLSLEAFPPAAEWDDTDEERLLEVAVAADVVVAIERPGPASDGCYYTMTGRDMGEVVAPIDRLLELVSTKQKHVHTIGIGDGGNEASHVGMGKVRDAILASAAVPSAELITCVTPADHLIVCSVSNWGGYALAAAAAAVACVRGAVAGPAEAAATMLPDEAQETAMLTRMVEAGARDGITGAAELSVDGMPLEASLQVLRDLRATLSTAKLALPPPPPPSQPPQQPEQQRPSS